MGALRWVFAVVWALFWIGWLAAAFTTKRGRVPWAREIRIRVVILVVVVVLVRLGVFRGHRGSADPVREVVGVVVFFAGIGLAVWARVTIGRNWGMPMTQKNSAELVTGGPYRLIRHPIYSGILLAGVGTGVALDWMWLGAVLIAGIYFVYAAGVEERYLETQFPETYPAYKRATKMLVPYVL